MSNTNPSPTVIITSANQFNGQSQLKRHILQAIEQASSPTLLVFADVQMS
jgi:hypothetical protein